MDERRNHYRLEAGREFRSTALVLGLAVLFLASVFSFSPIPVEQLSLDPNNVGGLPWFVGIVSMLGAVAWTVAVVAAAGGAWIASTVGRDGAASMLRGGALLSTLLLVDDLFQIHTLPYPLLGVPKSVVLGGYGLLALCWVAAEWQEILRTRTGLVLLAAALFAVSLAVDQFGVGFSRSNSGPVVALEDGAKFLGTAIWAKYFVMTAAGIIRSIVNQQSDLTSPTAEPREVSVATPR